MNGKKWLIASISLLVILLLGLGLWWGLNRYYHPLTLIHSVDRQNMIGYMEWRKQDQTALFGNDTLPLPPLLTKLGCPISTCSFWGEANAVVLRKINDELIWELYIAYPNKTVLQANWDNLTHGDNELLVDQQRYRLTWQDEVAIISPRNAQQLANQTTPASDMPWTKDGSWSVWGHFLAVGFCDRDCLWSNWQNAGSTFPLLTDFVADTISYSTFTIRTDKDGPVIKYKLNYTASYHASNSDKKNISTVIVPQGSQLLFRGQSLNTVIIDVLHDTQNQGLWKTIVDFGSQTSTGLALEALSKIAADYPYTITLDKKWQNTVIQLDMPASAWPVLQATITAQAQSVIPVLFPRKEAMVLPDSSIGYEWVKNTNLSYTWSPINNAQTELTVRNNKDNSVIVKLYATVSGQQVSLSMQPIKPTANQTCTLVQPYQEFNAWQYDNIHWLWSGITDRSISSEQGTIGWTKSIPGCVQN